MNTKQNRTQIKTDEDQTQKNWNNRELIETTDGLLRRIVEFLSNFHECTIIKLRTMEQRVISMERKLDFIEASLVNTDPSKRGVSKIPMKNSIFDKQTRRQNAQYRNAMRKKSESEIIYTNKIIAPMKFGNQTRIIPAVNANSNKSERQSYGVKKPSKQKKSKKVIKAQITSKQTLLPPPPPVPVTVQVQSVIKQPPALLSILKTKKSDVSCNNPTVRLAIPPPFMHAIPKPAHEKERELSFKSLSKSSHTPSPSLSAIAPDYKSKKGSLDMKYGAPPSKNPPPSFDGPCITGKVMRLSLEYEMKALEPPPPPLINITKKPQSKSSRENKNVAPLPPAHKRKPVPAKLRSKKLPKLPPKKKSINRYEHKSISDCMDAKRKANNSSESSMSSMSSSASMSSSSKQSEVSLPPPPKKMNIQKNNASNQQKRPQARIRIPPPAHLKRFQ